MTIPQLMPWIGGPVKFEAGFPPLVCPIDETVASQIIESDAKSGTSAHSATMSAVTSGWNCSPYARSP